MKNNIVTTLVLLQGLCIPLSAAAEPTHDSIYSAVTNVEISVAPRSSTTVYMCGTADVSSSAGWTGRYVDCLIVSGACSAANANVTRVSSVLQAESAIARATLVSGDSGGLASLYNRGPDSLTDAAQAGVNGLFDQFSSCANAPAIDRAVTARLVTRTLAGAFIQARRQRARRVAADKIAQLEDAQLGIDFALFGNTHPLLLDLSDEELRGFVRAYTLGHLGLGAGFPIIAEALAEVSRRGVSLVD